MAHKKLRFLALVGLLGLVAQASGAPPEGAQLAAMTSRLRTRATAWWGTRTRLVDTCSTCSGRGVVQQMRGRRIHTITCPSCRGDKVVLYSDPYRELFYDFRTERFRLRDGIRDRLEEEFKTAAKGGAKTRPMQVDRYRIESVEVLSDAAGVVAVKINRDNTARPQRWTWVPSGDGKGGEWFIADEEPGPGSTGAAPNDASSIAADALATEALTEAEAKAVDETIGGLAAISHEVMLRAKRGRSLVLELVPKDDVKGAASRQAATQDAVSLARALVTPLGWDSLHATWRTPYRNRLGEVELRPHATSSIDLDTLKRVVWENLKPEEEPNVLTWKRPRADPDWVPWD